MQYENFDVEIENIFCFSELCNVNTKQRSKNKKKFEITRFHSGCNKSYIILEIDT